MGRWCSPPATTTWPRANRLNNLIDVFRWVDGAVEIVSKDVDGGAPDQQCGSPDVSGDGATVVYQSAASDLVPGDTNGLVDIFVVAGLD